MAIDYFHIYQKAFVDTVSADRTKFFDNQIIQFDYRGGINMTENVVMVISIYPQRTLHALKLNEIRPTELFWFFRLMIDPYLVKDYIQSIEYGVHDERLRLNEYRLPLYRYRRPEHYYKTRIKKLAKTFDIYRTYDLDKIVNAEVAVPNLQLLGFLPKNVRLDESVTDEDRSKYLLSHTKYEDSMGYFGQQSKDFDEG